MPYSIKKSGNKWQVVMENGDPVPGGEHATESGAQAHMKALYANVQDATDKEENQEEEIEKTAKLDVTGQSKNFFIPLAKVDEERREVWGYAAVEEPDHSDEIMDYASSKPLWIDWSKSAQKRSGGRSLGNLRSMHKAIAAGKLIDFRPDDVRKGFWIGAKVVDDEEWKKVRAGVYTGFSVGGKYIRRWVDMILRKLRYTAQPAEVSLVDAPCIESASFQVIKADGVTEVQSFQPGDGTNILTAVDETEAVEKLDIPSAQEPAGSVDTTGGPQVEKIPEHETPMQLNPDNPPTTEEIATRHGDMNLESAAAEISGNPVTSPDVEKTEVNPEIKKIKVVPAKRRFIKVRSPRMVKISRS